MSHTCGTRNLSTRRFDELKIFGLLFVSFERCILIENTLIAILQIRLSKCLDTRQASVVGFARIFALHVYLIL